MTHEHSTPQPEHSGTTALALRPTQAIEPIQTTTAQASPQATPVVMTAGDIFRKSLGEALIIAGISIIDSIVAKYQKK